MGFRFQRRVNLGGGTGLNLSKSGIGASVRGRYGAIGSKGFSLRTGIPGLSFRQGWGGKRGDGAAVMLILGLMVLATALVAVLVQALIWLVPVIWQGGRWCVLTIHDYISYRRTGMQPDGDIASITQEEAATLDGLSEKTLEEILTEQSSQTDLSYPSTSPPEPARAIVTMSQTTVSVVQSDTTSHVGLIAASAVVLGIILLVSMCTRLGGSSASAPQFKDADIQAWRAVMLDEKQLASVRLSNAQAITDHFPNSPDARLASTMHSQLAQASNVEAVASVAATAAREADRQAMIDRKERRDPAISSAKPLQTDHTVELIAVGAAALASQANTKPARAESHSTRRSTSAVASTKRSRTAVPLRDKTCPCSGSFNCTGSRGGQYCITSGGNKRYR